MKVKIGDKIYDSSNEPIMLILSKKDKECIAKMKPNFSKCCFYPDGKDTEYILNFMKEDEL